VSTHDGTLIATTTAGADGSFSFVDLEDMNVPDGSQLLLTVAAGNYRVNPTIPLSPRPLAAHSSSLRPSRSRGAAISSSTGVGVRRRHRLGGRNVDRC
jgi:hypothetical protein